jgi:hypothetical protein
MTEAREMGLGWGPHIHAAGCPAGQGPAINMKGQP